MVLFFRYRLIMLCICSKFKTFLTLIKLWSEHNLSTWNKQMGIITPELKEGFWFFFSAHRLFMPYICKKFYKPF